MRANKSAAKRALAKAIRSTRERGGYSQEGFARHAGFEPSNYGAIERGEVNLSLDALLKIAHGLGTTGSVLCAKAKI